MPRRKSEDTEEAPQEDTAPADDGGETQEAPQEDTAPADGGEGGGDTGGDTGGDGGGDDGGGDSPDGPLVQSIDDRQLAEANVSSTPETTDARAGTDQPNPADNPAAPDDVSNTVDPNDAMTLTKGDDPQGGNA